MVLTDQTTLVPMLKTVSGAGLFSFFKRIDRHDCDSIGSAEDCTTHIYI